jgi:hypothetical protein
MMNALSIRDEVIAEIKEMSDEEIATVLKFIKSLHIEEYDERKDPFLTGEMFFSGTPDLGERAEEILEQELGIKNEMEDET